MKRVLLQIRIAFLFAILFFVFYSVLSLIRHAHYGSYGFDLGITDQVVWQYSHLRSPITTIQAYPFTSILSDHVEFIYMLLAPFYWIYSSPVTILLLQAFFVTFSSIPIYLLAKEKRLHPLVCYALQISYLSFYGVQNALWFDVHSLSFAAGFLSWFVYFLERKNRFWTVVTFFLAILCKEDIALLTGIISFVYFIRRRDMFDLVFGILSGVYLFTVFAIYFPHFTRDGYRYQSKGGLFSNLQITYLYDSPDKRTTVLYSLGWFGVIPLLSPLLLLPAVGDLMHYYVFGHAIQAADGLFMHYRISLAPLLALPTIMAIARHKWLNNKYIAGYLLLLAVVLQYSLHLPLSYLTKKWFWHEPKSVGQINAIVASLPVNASVVSQNNITPHLSQRKLIFTLYPSLKTFSHNSPCGKKACDWFRWAGNPEYLVVDTSTDWDARSFLTDRDTFINSLQNLEKAGVIRTYKQIGEAYVFKIQKI